MAEKKEFKDMKTGEKIAGVIGLVVIVLAGWWIISSVFGGSDKNVATKNDAAVESSSSIAKTAADIQAKKNSAGACVYEDKRSEYSTVGTALRDATTNFVNLAKKIDFNTCEVFQYGLYIPVTGGDMTSVMTLRIDTDNKAAFDAYDWSNLKNTGVYDRLEADKIATKLNTAISGIDAKDVRYAGQSEELK